MAVRLLWGLVLLLAAAVMVLALYPVWSPPHRPIAERAALDTTCDLRRGPCRLRFDDGGQVELDIRPRGIPVVRPLRIGARLDGLVSPTRVTVHFSGVDMDMGHNAVRLQPAAAPGTWQGEGMLPVCVRQRMTWEALVVLDGADGSRAAPFRFDTHGVGARAP